ncbi:hypothetical protein G9A89_008050 [Geosiphon pyriformis]|nr:hypothetical protein G9A89_008050 [Geosiphon pyriformis]
MPKAKRPKLITSLAKIHQEKITREKYAEKFKSKSKTGSGGDKLGKKGHHQKPLLPPPYSSDDSILLIGEGNFSFARSLAEDVLNTGHLITATACDSEKIVYEKYGNASEHIKLLQEFGAKVFFEVDGTQLEKFKTLKGKRFDKIVFNFPHTGSGIKDKDRNILANQKLLNAFFQSAIPFLTSRLIHNDLKDGEIHITIRSGPPYDEWNIRQIAKSTDILVVERTIPFLPQQYPNYEHRRTLGFKDGVSKCKNEEIIGKKPKTIIFVRKEVIEFQKEEGSDKKNGNKNKD